MEYSVEELLKNKVMRVDFRFGFRIQPRIGVMFRKVISELTKNKEIEIQDTGDLMHSELNDFRFVILERFLSYDNEFSFKEGFILNSYFSLLKFARSDNEAYGIDSNQAVVEKVPLVVQPISSINLKRKYIKSDHP
jgi:KUP system potassium uptake protein